MRARHQIHQAAFLPNDARETHLRILLTIVGCFVVAVAAGLDFIYSGLNDVSASTPDNAFVAWVVRVASDHSVDARLGAFNYPPFRLGPPAQAEPFCARSHDVVFDPTSPNGPRPRSTKRDADQHYRVAGSRP